jgi:hypothetical protein
MYCCSDKSKLNKLDPQLVLDTFVVPGPIKDTNQNATSINEAGVPKALENSIPKVDNIKETGKVTAVVAVMQVNTNLTKDCKTGKNVDIHRDDIHSFITRKDVWHTMLYIYYILEAKRLFS